MLQEDHVAQINPDDEGLWPTQNDLETINLNDWYLRSQAAEKLQCSEKYVHKLATKHGTFAYHKVSAHLMLYWRKGVDRYAAVRPGQVGRPKTGAALKQKEQEV